jgi:hypothetical protein
VIPTAPHIYFEPIKVLYDRSYGFGRDFADAKIQKASITPQMKSLNLSSNDQKGSGGERGFFSWGARVRWFKSRRPDF